MKKYIVLLLLFSIPLSAQPLRQIYEKGRRAAHTTFPRIFGPLEKDNQNPLLHDILTHFTTLADDELIRRITIAYPEMEQLKGAAEVTAEGTSKTGCISFRLYGINAPEFDRTAVGILALKWLLQGDYAKFTSPQPSPRLSEKSFHALKKYTQNIVKNNNILDALIGFLVINDLGKVRAVIDTITQKTGIETADHDELLLIALQKYPAVSPTFQRLAPHFQTAMIQGLAASFNLAQFMQGESLPANLAGVAKINKQALDLFNLHALFDIAGAAGHTLNCISGTIINETTYRSFMEAFNALKQIKNKSLTHVYNAYVRAKAKTWDFAINTPKQYALARLALMMRIPDRTHLDQLQKSFDALPSQTQQVFITQLTRTGIDDTAILLYYSPALLVNAQRTAGQAGVTSALHVMANIFNAAQKAPAYPRHPGVYVVNIRTIAQQATDKDALSQMPDKKITITAVGADGMAQFIE